MNILEQLESEEFRKFLNENVIPYEEINGIKTIPDSFIIDNMNFDAIQKAEEFSELFPELSANEKSEFISSTGFVNLQIKRIIQEEIAKFTSDVKFNGTLNDYLDCFERLGFELVLEIPYNNKDSANFSSVEAMNDYLKDNDLDIVNDSMTKKDNGGISVDYISHDKEMFFYNKNSGALIHMDTWNGKSSNSINLYANGNLRDNVKNRQTHCNIIPQTDSYFVNIDFRELPLAQYSQFLKEFSPVKEWKTFDTSLHSYLSHDNVDVGDAGSWSSIQISKLKQLPKNVLDNLFSKNVYISQHDRLDGFYEEYYGDSTLSKLKNAINNELSKEALKESLIYDYIFDTRYSKNYKKAFSPKVSEELESLGFKIDEISEYGGILNSKVHELFVFNDISKDEINNVVDNFSEDELKLIVFSKESFRIKYDVGFQGVLKRVENKLDSIVKVKKNKSKLH